MRNPRSSPINDPWDWSIAVWLTAGVLWPMLSSAIELLAQFPHGIAGGVREGWSLLRGAFLQSDCATFSREFFLLRAACSRPAGGLGELHQPTFVDWCQGSKGHMRSETDPDAQKRPVALHRAFCTKLNRKTYASTLVTDLSIVSLGT
jgi:hypothetical protein